MAGTEKNNLREQVAMLPQSPGVYQFVDRSGTIIYVGKAKSLRKRVSSYFVQSKEHSPKVRVLVKQIAEIRHIVVDSETDALLLENSLIKTLQPRYNILLKDDKTYPWIVVRREHFPRVQSTRQLNRDGSQYFGPYGSVVMQHSVLDFIREVVPLRTCKLNLAPEQIAKAQTVTQSYVDICVGSREEAEALGIHAGAQIVPDSPLESIGPDGDYICTRAADCRALCAVIIETLKELKAEDIHGEVVAAFNIIEETTVKGIAAATNKYPCEYGLFLDTIPCGDVPDVDFGKELPVALKKGPVLLHSQLFMGLGLRAGSHPKLVEAVRNAAEKTGANHQEFAFNGAGYVTDAVGAVLTGMAVVSLALPRRYSHSPVELFHMNDICDTQKTVEEFLKNEVDLGLLHK